MTTEDDFQRVLDARPDDHATRLVFADWLEERGDPRAEGYRALAAHGRRPRPATEGAPYRNWAPDITGDGRGQVNTTLACPLSADALPWDWWRGCQERYRSRRAAEDAAALAFARLPAARRAELLGPVAAG